LNITEQNFVGLLRQRNEDALEFMVRTYGGMMKAVIRRILYAHPEDAEECLYDSIMKIWEHIGSYDEVHPFEAWAATIAKYTALNRLRQLERIEPTVDITEMQIEDTAQLTADSNFNSFFAELTACLSDEDKLLFTRIFWLGQSPEEAARSMGKDRSVVYNRISRGKKKIMHNNPGYFRKEES
jgi:RNA polymerase sigma-70 factor (ECF subfamily)